MECNNYVKFVFYFSLFIDLLYYLPPFTCTRNYSSVFYFVCRVYLFKLVIVLLKASFSPFHDLPFWRRVLFHSKRMIYVFELFYKAPFPLQVVLHFIPALSQMLCVKETPIFYFVAFKFILIAEWCGFLDILSIRRFDFGAPAFQQ